MQRNLQIVDLPADADELADDQLDVVTGAMSAQIGIVCSALSGGRQDCFWA
ncbi:hypothetical protein GCM10010517_17320 [Streptosporangium fragile]|uniref:Uncharacterized protein n=1 Tax=Streptosporangium fragile TaxID=46186 RepID=A0ABN3VSX8_9ACTN